MNDHTAGPLPYEIHVTVRTDDVDAFKQTCQTIGVKPIVIDLTDMMGNSIMRDVMTSSKHKGTDESVMAEVKRITQGLAEAGLVVVREKVESAPWHPLAPSVTNPRPMQDGQYFECHFAVRTTPDRMDELSVLARQCDCHRSRNVFKKFDDGEVVVMMTKRTYAGTAEEFTASVRSIERLLNENRFPTEKVEIEFSIHDTKVKHDAAWLKVG
jgi:hypothetical protein